MAAIKKGTGVTCLFLDIGGVLLSNGWDEQSRRMAAKAFRLNWREMEDRHLMNVGLFEDGKLTLEDYLSRVVFYKKRSFTRGKFREFMFAQSKPYPRMIKLIRTLKSQYGLKTAVVSNEARELNAYRIGKFKLNEFVDFFVSSCYVGLRKPDEDIFHLALDIAQVPPRKVVMIDDRSMFVEIARGLGMRGIHHENFESTCVQLASFGLIHDDKITGQTG
jgi:putative hydrolase of the HAD superfamily